MPRTLLHWLDYIYGLHPREIDLGLDRMHQLAGSLSLTHFSCPVVMVAGTNGKGSTIKFLESIYLAAGYRVAAYTSPHVVKFNERLRINGQAVADKLLIQAFECIERARSKKSLSFFEFTTLAALHICRGVALDVLLLEIGLGGRLDAVNIVNPDVSVISNIDIDHVEQLGSDRESIGKEKAGIIRPHVPVICGDENPPQCLFDISIERQAPLFYFGKDFHTHLTSDCEWEWQGPQGHYTQLPYPHLKLQNAATSLMVIDQLQSALPVTQERVRLGIKNATLSGRFERVTVETQSKPYKIQIIYDVAHNPQSMAYLAEQIRALSSSGKVLAVMGMLKDKDIAQSVTPLLPVIDAWYVGTLAGPRGASANEILLELTAQGGKNCYNFASVAEAFNQAVSDYRELDRLLVFGSFYTVGIVKSLFSQA